MIFPQNEHKELIAMGTSKIVQADKRGYNYYKMNISTPMDNSTNFNDTINPEMIIREAEDVQSGSNYLIYIIAVIVLIIAFIIIQKRKTKTAKRQIGVVGERATGKTQLFISLSGGKSLETVPSIVNNTCSFEVNHKQYRLCDFMGDNLSKEQIISQIARFHTLIHVVDGTDSKQLADAALFVYRILINKQFQKDPCNYIIFLNKSDQTGFHGQQKLVKRIEDQIETIKVTRKNQPEDNQDGEDDYLRNQRTRFDLKRQGIRIVEGSARQNIKTLASTIDSLCG